jgi:soluble lytic murein transglycosylase-like protein
VFIALLAAGRPKPGVRMGLAAPAAPRSAVATVTSDDAFPRIPPLPAPPDPQRDAFALDLVATGQVAPGRAERLADWAVRYARAHHLPPALVLGVLLVENEALDSRAVSSAGARGLMQVHPLWRPLLGPRYGFDLTADSTNLAMGAHILADVLARARTLADVERGLLRYNGCRRALLPERVKSGERAEPVPCAQYPLRVRRRVEEQVALCPTRSFARCVVRPLRLASAERPRTTRSGD